MDPRIALGGLVVEVEIAAARRGALMARRAQLEAERRPPLV